MEMAIKSLWLVQVAVIMPTIGSLIAMHRNTRSRWHVQLMGPAYIMLIMSHASDVWFAGESSLSLDKLLALTACGLGNATLIKMAIATNRIGGCGQNAKLQSKTSSSRRPAVQIPIDERMIGQPGDRQ